MALPIALPLLGPINLWGGGIQPLLYFQMDLLIKLYAPGALLPSWGAHGNGRHLC